MLQLFCKYFVTNNLLKRQGMILVTREIYGQAHSLFDQVRAKIRLACRSFENWQNSWKDNCYKLLEKYNCYRSGAKGSCHPNSLKTTFEIVVYIYLNYFLSQYFDCILNINDAIIVGNLGIRCESNRRNGSGPWLGGECARVVCHTRQHRLHSRHCY